MHSGLVDVAKGEGMGYYFNCARASVYRNQVQVRSGGKIVVSYCFAFLNLATTVQPRDNIFELHCGKKT